MKKITASNYRSDPYYPRIVRAVAEILEQGNVVTPIAIFSKMGLLSPKMVEDWRFGHVPYLEKVLQCNLSKAGRILRILRLHAHALNLKPSQTIYKKLGRGRKLTLRFSKTGDPNLEEAYSRHFIRLPPPVPGGVSNEEARFPCGSLIPPDFQGTRRQGG